MERSLDDTISNSPSANDDLKPSYPLLSCIQSLKETHHTLAKLHRDRYEQVQKLVSALQSYASHLESSFVTIPLPPPISPNNTTKTPQNFDLSPSYVARLDQEFTRVYEEYARRVALVASTADEIITLWSELGTPQAQIDSAIVSCAHEAPEQLGLHTEDLARLNSKRDKLIAEKGNREKKLRDLRSSVEALWERLSIPDSERKQFLAANRGVGVRQINEFEDELGRLNELKKANLHLFVEDARFTLQKLWDELYFSEEEMLDFAPAFSDVVSDALLSAHEHEISRLESLKAQRAPILAAVEKHRSLIQDRLDLEASSQDASRLLAGPKGQGPAKRDPGKLLREEKMRKRITKELPKVEADLRRVLESWEDEYGRPFCVRGERYLDELESSASARPKAMPPRSKTPNALPASVREAPKSASRAGTLRGPPPARSKTPTAHPPSSAGHGRSALGASVMGASVSAYSTSTIGRTSPSKIPAAGTASRLPMSALRDGPNSPERRARPVSVMQQQQQSHKPVAVADDLSSTVRSRFGAHPPPPRMKDLFVPLPPTPVTMNKENLCLDRSASVVRHVEMEDPYSTSYPAKQQPRTMLPPPPRPHYERAQPSSVSVSSNATTRYTPSSSSALSTSSYPSAPPSLRNTSNTSSVVASGSENWETYTDASEDEDEDERGGAGARTEEEYYAQGKVRAQQYRGGREGEGDGAGTVKRPATATGLKLGGVKRVREGVGETF